MAEPTLHFLYNSTAVDTPYTGTGDEDSNYKKIIPSVDKIVFTGGGIDDVDKNMGNYTLASGTRSATIRPSVTSYIIPYTYVETAAGMYRVPLAGHNTSRYVMCTYVSGTVNSDVYLEAWDDYGFSTYDLPVLSGSSDSSYNSYVNAIRTTDVEPPWAPGWDGNSTGAEFLRGETQRVALDNSSSISNKALYYNVYIRLQPDTVTFHNTPVFGFRYLYT